MNRQGDAIVRFELSGRSWAGWLLAVAATWMLAACGGGGASPASPGATNQGGAPTMAPNSATFFAGVVNTITITGGRRPYTLSSSEPSLLAVPQTLSAGSFQVVPANPAVVDTGLPPDALPVRTVIITLTDANGQTTSSTIKVGVNFLTGLGVSFSSNCAAGSGGTAPAACAGGDTVLSLNPSTNGNLIGGKTLRLDVIRGPFQFVDANGATVPSITVTTDHSGRTQALLRVTSNVSGQFGVVRVTDVATGVFVDEVFPITGAPQSTLTVVPNTFTFTGALTTQCGTGSGDFVVFDGVPPYSAVSSDPNIRVSPTTTNANPGVFTITAFNNSVCITGAQVIVTDSQGGRATVTVNTAAGSTAPPTPPPLIVNPTTITLACGTSGSVTAVGGNGTFIVNSTHPRVTAVASGNTITITRLDGDPPGSSFPTTGAVSVSDGTTISTVTLTVPASCP